MKLFGKNTEVTPASVIKFQPPHCDSAILHAPGECKYCDLYPELQEYREFAQIAFTNSPEELGTDNISPCPSTWFRSPEVRDRWGGNVESH